MSILKLWLKLDEEIDAVDKISAIGQYGAVEVSAVPSQYEGLRSEPPGGRLTSSAEYAFSIALFTTVSFQLF